MATSNKIVTPKTPGANPTVKLYWWQLISALSGIAISVYLLVQHTRLKSGIQEGASFCTLGKYADCDAVNVSRFSELFGIPIAGIGACFYFIVLLVVLMASPKAPLFRRTQRVILWLTSAALTIDAILFIIQLAALKNVCLMCFLTYVASLCIFIPAVLMSTAAFAGAKPWERLTAAFTSDLGPKVKVPTNGLAVCLLGLIAFVAVMITLPNSIRLHSNVYTNVDNALQQFYAHWKDEPVKNIDVEDGDGTFGDPNAKVKIIEYSDFQCPHCRKAAFTMHTALKTLGNRVFFIFKNFPLDLTCNPMMSFQLHPQACKLARLAYCSAKKGNFWEYHDIIFFKLSEDEIKNGMDNVIAALQPIFTKEEVDACLKNDASEKNVTDSLRVGNSLGVRGTPSVFINGKAVKDIPITVETLEKLVQIEESN